MKYSEVEDINIKGAVELSIYTTPEGFVIDVKDKYGNLIKGRILEVK